MWFGFCRKSRKARISRIASPRLATIGALKPIEVWLSKRKVRIGIAADNDLIIPDTTVSRHHALIKRRFRRYRLIDLESTNGTFVNGRRVRGPTPIARGDELRFGAVRFVFLRSPATRELRRGISLKAGLVVVALVFATGFSLTEHFLNRSLLEELSVTSPRQTIAVASLERQHKEAVAQLGRAPEQASQPLWLQRVNYYRRLSKVPPVVEDPSLSHADFLHSHYLVKYKLRTGSLPFEHTEDPNAPYYTPEGLKAAENSDLAEADGTQLSDEQAVDGWMNGPFHRLAILNPDVRNLGFGTYSEAGFQAVAAYLSSPPSLPHPFKEPVEFPPPDSIIPLAIYTSGEWPDPLTSCPGYTAPTGLPITLQLGAWVPTQVTAHSFTHNGQPLAHCAFDAGTYTNPDTATEKWARQGLRGSSAVILIPRDPLTSGEHYTVSIGVGSSNYAWSFGVR